MTRCFWVFAGILAGGAALAQLPRNEEARALDARGDDLDVISLKIPEPDALRVQGKPVDQRPLGLTGGGAIGALEAAEHQAVAVHRRVVERVDRQGMTEVRVKERMTTNPNDACVDGGTIVIPIAPTEDTLDFKWLYPDGKVGVTATLAR